MREMSILDSTASGAPSGCVKLIQGTLQPHSVWLLAMQDMKMTEVRSTPILTACLLMSQHVRGVCTVGICSQRGNTEDGLGPKPWSLCLAFLCKVLILFRLMFFFLQLNASSLQQQPLCAESVLSPRLLLWILRTRRNLYRYTGLSTRCSHHPRHDWIFKL